MKLAYIDVETTGIPYPESGLIQLAGIIEVDDEIVDRFDFRVRPFPTDIILDEALDVNGVTREDLKTFDSPVDVHKKFIEVLDKHVDRYDKNDKLHFVGYNAEFDANHLRSWFKKNDDNYFGSWFWHPPLDAMTFAAIGLMRRRHDLANFQLTTVARSLGIDVEEADAHDALYDVNLTRQIFRMLIDRIRAAADP